MKNEKRTEDRIKMKVGGKVDCERDEMTSKDSKEIRTSSPLFVPASLNGKLNNKMKAEEERMGLITGWKCKIVERGGVMLRNLLTKSNSYSKEDCGRESCHACKHATKPFNCRRRGGCTKHHVLNVVTLVEFYG